MYVQTVMSMSFVIFPAVNGGIRKYSYKNINRLKAKLRQFQAIEGETVPEKVYDIIK